MPREHEREQRANVQALATKARIAEISFHRNA
jgi:hypothetical protein